MRETWTRLAMHDFGLPGPAVQYWVVVDGVPTYRLDLAYPHARIAIEYDGRLHHTSRADRARDEQRRAWLRAHGWTVIVVRAADLAPGADDGWLYAVRDALSRPAKLREVVRCGSTPDRSCPLVTPFVTSQPARGDASTLGVSVRGGGGGRRP